MTDPFRSVQADTTRRTGRGSVISWLLTAAYMAGIYWLSSLPGTANPDAPVLFGFIAWTPPAVQNLLHIPLYGILAWLWHRSLAGWITRPRWHHMAVLFLTIGYGIADEWHQFYVAGRYASLTDILLNCAGALTAVWLLNRRRHSGRQAPG